MALFTRLGPGHNLHTTVLHPYFKLSYIKLAWGGPHEQKAEREAGNPFAKNWQDEALQIVENAVRGHPSFTYGTYLICIDVVLDGALLQEPANYSKPNNSAHH
jgi:hypothetical protein